MHSNPIPQIFGKHISSIPRQLKTETSTRRSTRRIKKEGHLCTQPRSQNAFKCYVVQCAFGDPPPKTNPTKNLKNKQLSSWAHLLRTLTTSECTLKYIVFKCYLLKLHSVIIHLKSNPNYILEKATQFFTPTFWGWAPSPYAFPNR